MVCFHEFIFNQMDNVMLNGRCGSLHFIRFPTSEIQAFLQLLKAKQIATVSSTVCATGGGAYKFEKDFQQVSSFKLQIKFLD